MYFLLLKHKVWLLVTSVDNHLKRAELSDLILGRTFFEVETDNNFKRIEVSSNSLTFGQGGNRLTFWGPHNFSLFINFDKAYVSAMKQKIDSA